MNYYFLYRLSAKMLDVFIFLVIVFCIDLFVPNVILSYLLLALVYILYFVVSVYYTKQTLGKKLLGLRIEDKNGNKPSIMQIVFREPVNYIFILITLASLIYKSTNQTPASILMLISIFLGFILTFMCYLNNDIWNKLTNMQVVEKEK